jgi:hypothetical protein
MNNGNAADVEFNGPPPGRGRHGQIAGTLVARRGEWALIRRYGSAASAGSVARAIRTGRIAAYAPTGAFEATARTITEGDTVEHRVYARYIGGGGAT